MLRKTEKADEAEEIHLLDDLIWMELEVMPTSRYERSMTVMTLSMEISIQISSHIRDKYQRRQTIVAITIRVA